MKRKILCFGLAFLIIFALTGISFAEDGQGSEEGTQPAISEPVDDMAQGNDTASGNETISDDSVPLAGYQPSDMVLPAAPAQWALLNLLAVLATILFSVILLFRIIVNQLKGDDEVLIRNRIPMRLVSVFVGLVAAFAFSITEDLGGSMIIGDTFTPIMFVFPLAQISIMIMAKRRKEQLENLENNGPLL